MREKAGGFIEFQDFTAPGLRKNATLPGGRVAYEVKMCAILPVTE